ncbi:hypothetical protein CEXT_219961 [Caerostris extrusa]|uniref:Uncharacterized protein n=1 Tax=Caerostris extrusa TaxID=172846 RepID=A0AAV4MDA6_CAEEX|nr:hypothetical protein CEXT_219961 [Caerostris extrusa]
MAICYQLRWNQLAERCAFEYHPIGDRRIPASRKEQRDRLSEIPIDRMAICHQLVERCAFGVPSKCTQMRQRKEMGRVRFPPMRFIHLISTQTLS